MSLAGDVNGDGYSDVIVGAPLYGEFIFGWTIFGRAFLYLGSASGLSASAAWSAMGPVGSEFGRPVAGAGDVNGDGYSDVIVGAYAHTNGQVSEGRAYVYHGSASGLSTTPAWITESNQAGALFGNTVATAGDVNGDGYDDVILGSVKYDNGETDEGRAFVFHGSSTGLSTTSAWTFEPNQSFAYLQVAASAGDVNGDGFGDVVVASTDFDNGEVDEGAAWVFLGSASGLAASGTLLEANQASASFGARVASAGDLDGDGYDDVAVGIPLFDNGHTNEGQVRVYRGSSTGITTAVAFQYEPDAAESRFGRAVAGAGDVNGDGHPDLLVGAHRFTNGETNEGAAFVFHGAAGTLLSTPAWTGEPDSFGASVSSVGTAGDVNADGFDDVIWGSPFYTNNHSNEGAAFCFYGSESGPSGSPDWFFESDIDVALYGTSIACAGDVNGDGYDDLIVGAPNVGNGRAFLYLGTPTGLSLAPDWTGDPNITLAQFGFKVASAGDVDADGFGDVVVLAPSADSGQVNEGIGFVYRGSPSGLGSSPAWTIESNQDFSDFTCVACAGDVNGDGFSDIAAGYRQFDNGQSNEGRVAVFHGSSGGPSTSPDWTFETGQASSTLGELASAGDVNGDGYSDLIVGASNFDNGQNNEGRAFLFLGSPSGLAPAPAWFAEGDQADAFYGIAVGSAGDVNGDGLSDVVVGALGYDVASSNDNRGRAYLYLGNALGLSAAPSLIIQGDQNFANFGSAVSRAGDANGDGYGDVIVGAQSHDNGSTNEGRAFLYYGNENGSPTLRPRQKRATGRPLAVLDRTGPSTFQLSVEFDRDLTGVAWSRPGGSTARLQWELAPLGGTFDGIPDGESAPQTITGTTLSFDELIGGLLPDTLYHWRARIATTNPLYPNTPWFTIQGRPVTEAKFRTQKAKAQATSGTPGNGGTRTIP